MKRENLRAEIFFSGLAGGLFRGSPEKADGALNGPSEGEIGSAIRGISRARGQPCVHAAAGSSCLLVSVPVRARPAAGEIIEGEIVARDHFGEEDDLPRVHREVFDDVEDGREQRHVVALNLAAFEER